MLIGLLLVAAPPPLEILQMLDRTVEVHGAVISRDGGRVAWVEQEATPDGPDWEHSSIRVRTGDAEPVRVGTGKRADEGDLAFSPDGSSLAFLSDAERQHQPQLYVADLGTGKVRQLTHVDGHLEKPRFSPDGKTIAVLFIAGGADLRGPLLAAARVTGVVDEQVKEQRIALVPLDGNAELKPVSPPDLFVYEYAWRPDGTAFAATAAPGSGDDNWWIAKLYVIDPNGARVVYTPALQICEPSWSPSGDRIAFIEGLMSDHGSNGGDLLVVPADGSARARNLTPGIRASVSSVRWVKPDEVLVRMVVEGDIAFAAVPSNGGAPRILWRGGMYVPNDWTVTADGSSIATMRDSFTEPPEIVAGPIGAWKPITQTNASLHSPAGAARSIHWKSDRFDVQGWLLEPPEKPAGKAPMIVVVHGGPAGFVASRWIDEALLLASQGYYVFLPNFRGSFGQGEEFTRANVKDFGYGDLRDIQRGIDAVSKEAPVDPERIGLYGHSYGGYMAMWAVTQTRRFKAVVASAGIVNWQSYYGQNLIDQWMIPYFGKSVYDDPAVYARSSPITFIKRVRTPTLVLHGERDAEVPLPQGQEFWHALKTLGVETQFVIYGNEGHHVRQPEHVRDRTQRIVDWFNRHLKAAGIQ